MTILQNSGQSVSGATNNPIATDQPGGSGDHYQIVKQAFGPNGSAPTVVSTANPYPVRRAPVGQGSYASIPAGSTNGTLIGTAPTSPAPDGVRLAIPGGASVTYFLSTTAPTGAPATGTTITMTNPAGQMTAFVDENLSQGQNMYITAVSGSPSFRYV